MSFLVEVLADAIDAFSEFGPELWDVVVLTVVVSGISTFIGVIVGVPLGGFLATERFPGAGLLRTSVNVGMGLPPVLAGLFVLLLFWRSGPFGSLGLVFTPTAMVIAQVLLAIPVAAGVTSAAIRGLSPDAIEQLNSLRMTPRERVSVAIGEARSGVSAAVVAAFGRVVAEVGAVLIVGGNILGETRVLTTLIVQESRQAQFGVAIAAGLILLMISLIVNLVLARIDGTHGALTRGAP